MVAAPVESAPVSSRAPDVSGPVAIEFCFEPKQERRIALDDCRTSMEAGRFVWLDLPIDEAGDLRRALAVLGLESVDDIVHDAMTGEAATQVAKYDEFIHLVLTGCRLNQKHFDLERVDLLVGERFLLTAHKGRVAFLEAVRKVYRTDFQRFARTPSFLVYELWDHLVDNYLVVQRKFEERVEAMQQELIGDVDDRVFLNVSQLGSDLLHFRKVLLPARAVLTELSTRRSPFISESTQPFLGNMVGTLERVLQDLLVDRDILSESLNLYMSMVGHRTNRVMNRLTVVSVIFLPLTFLCGVYGMNFEQLPETKWEHGYLFFWGLTLLIVAGLLWVMRKNKLL